MKRNNRRYEAIWWSVELPDGWAVEVHPECTTFTSGTLKGVLQVSAYRKDSEIGEDELLGLADEQPAPDRVEMGHFTGLSNTFERAGVRWKRWWLARDRILVFVTYNGPVTSVDVEIGIAENVLSTLQLRR